MASALDLIAGLLTSYRCNMQTLDWSALRYQHTAAIRSMLAELYAPSTANKMLAALRRSGKVRRRDWSVQRFGHTANEILDGKDDFGFRKRIADGLKRPKVDNDGREIFVGQMAVMLKRHQGE